MKYEVYRKDYDNDCDREVIVTMLNDNPDVVDEITSQKVDKNGLTGGYDVHIEKMDDNHYWGHIGWIVEFDIVHDEEGKIAIKVKSFPNDEDTIHVDTQ